MSGAWRRPSRAWILAPIAFAMALVAMARMHPLDAALAEPPGGQDGGAVQRAELQRCRAGGAPADPACQAVWRAARARFLGSRP